MTSRVLGLVRDQVLASLFGAGNAMDAFNIAFRIPNLLRDLFAEGAMSAAFVPTFTRRAHGRRTGRAPGGSATTSSTSLLADHRRRSWCSGIVFAEPLVALFAGGLRGVPGQARADDPAHAHHAAVPDARGDGGGRDGDAELAAPLLRAGAVAGDVQRRDDCLRVARSCR